MSLRLLRRNNQEADAQQQPPSHIEARPGRRHKKLRSLNLSKLSPLRLMNKNNSSGDLLVETNTSSWTTPRRLASPRMTATFDAEENVVLHWMGEQCPIDLVPKILSFAGPQTVAALGRTCRSWHSAIQSQAVWRTLCEDQYKWVEGDPIPPCWKEYYRLNPCVPIDYKSIQTALAVASDRDEDLKHAVSNVNPLVLEQRRSIRILLRPGRYVLRKALVVHAIGSARVTIETLQVPGASFCCLEDDHTLAAATNESSSLSRRAHRMRNILSCRYADTVMDDVQVMEEAEYPQQEASYLTSSPEPPVPGRATLVLKTRRHDEPIVRVRQGSVRLSNLELVHNCHGTDIWNGNAAIQIQPPMQNDVPVQVVPRPSASLDRVEVFSRSGRGVVTIDGGSAKLNRCYIHDCAATGIYVGGMGTHAIITKTDVLRNGKGARRGVARGHSGIYLEQGTASIENCNVSQNTLTGISAVSAENAVLRLRESDLVANGTVQLEMPPTGSISRRQSETLNNLLLTQGLGRSRSGLVMEHFHAAMEIENVSR